MASYKYTRNGLNGTITVKGWPCEMCGGTEFEVRLAGHDTKWGEPCDLLCVRCRKNHDTRRGKLMAVRFRRDGRIVATEWMRASK